MFGWRVGWLGFFGVFFLCWCACRSSTSESSWPVFFLTIILLEWKSVPGWRQTEIFFSPTLHRSVVPRQQCECHHHSDKLSLETTCLLPMRRNSLQNLCFLVHGPGSQWLYSLLLKWRWIEMVVFYMLSICLCKDCPRADNLVFFLWSTTTSIC